MRAVADVREMVVPPGSRVVVAEADLEHSAEKHGASWRESADGHEGHEDALCWTEAAWVAYRPVELEVSA